jgi:hypothetical protein
LNDNGKRFVVITTDQTRRGVFSGFLEDGDVGGTVTLSAARACVYWSAETRGVLGLAARGPAKGSRIGPAVPSLTVDGVTAIIDATDEARAAWEAEPWAKD